MVPELDTAVLATEVAVKVTVTPTAGGGGAL
jgi:hypothetical protein